MVDGSDLGCNEYCENDIQALGLDKLFSLPLS